jgi:hypothetical protein
MRLISIALVSLCLWPLPARSEELPMRGFGLHACAGYLDLYRTGKEGADTVFGSWAMGFMSATNIALMSAQERYHDLGSMPAEDQMVKIRDYCTSHPQAKFWEAVIDLYNSLPLRAYSK